MRYKKKNIDPNIKQRAGQTGVEANCARRTKRFEIRFTPDEWESLQQRAVEAGSSSAAIFARSILLPAEHRKNQEAKADQKLRLQLLASLGKIGSNINQIARALNRMKVWNETTEGMFQELHKIQEAIRGIADVFGRKN